MAKNEKENREPEQDFRSSKDKSNVEDLAERKLSQKAKKAGSAMRHWFSDQKERAEQIYDGTEEQIKKNPFASTAIAFAAGAMITVLLCGGRNKINKSE